MDFHHNLICGEGMFPYWFLWTINFFLLLIYTFYEKKDNNFQESVHLQIARIGKSYDFYKLSSSQKIISDLSTQHCKFANAYKVLERPHKDFFHPFY